MKHKYKHLDEEYFVNSCISGLKGEVRHMVELLTHVTVEQALLIAERQDILLDVVCKSKTLVKSISSSKVVKFGTDISQPSALGNINGNIM